MSILSQTAREIRQDAAALPTGELRTQIHVGIRVLEAFLEVFEDIRPGAGNVSEAANAAGDVIHAALRTALYVSELTKRPAPAVRFEVSPN